MAAARKRAVAAPNPGPFKVELFPLTDPARASIWRNGAPFMQELTPEGAERLVAIINSAIALAAEPGLVSRMGGDFARQRIAYAVAKAMGGDVAPNSFEARN